MSYVVSNYRESKTIFVADGTIDNSLDIFLLGKNFSGYGEFQNQNLVYLLENFAGSIPPAKPLNGQLWYDTLNKKIKVYDSTISIWKTTSSTEVSSNPPTGRSIGDLWWDSTNNQLYTYNGSSFTLIGPQLSSGIGTTQVKSISVLDTNNVAHAVLASYVNGSVIFIISDDEFVLNAISSESLGGPSVFLNIKKGVTLANTGDQGVSQNNTVVWGNSSNSLKLNGFESSDFYLKSELNFGNFNEKALFSDEGFDLGENNDFSLIIQNGTGNLIEDGLVPIIRSNTTNIIKFQTFDRIDNNVKLFNTPLKLVGVDILPGVNNSSNLGSETFKFNNVYAGNFIGTILSAQNGDLAENYLPDDDTYDVGTVVKIGGTAEITQCQQNDIVLGVISNKPGFIMNSELSNGISVALKGRLPVKVSGKINKGDRLTSYHDGSSIKANSNEYFFAISLEDNDNEQIKLVEAVVI